MPPVGPHLLTCFQSAPCFSSLSQNSQVGIRPRYPDRRDPISLNNPGSQGRDQEGERGSQQGQPMTLHFTRLDGSEPRKLLLKGHRKAGGVVRLWPDDCVTTHLCIAEGVATALSAAWAYQPAWATVDCGNLSAFPVLPGVEVLVIAADHDPAGLEAAEACAERWTRAGREVVLWVPDAKGEDWNDVARRVA